MPREMICEKLNDHLRKNNQRRKSESDLSSILQGTAHELQIAQTKDQLSQLMRKQRDRKSLVEQGILLDEHCVAGSIQSNAKELERNIICDKVEQGLRERHSKGELEKSGVIKEGADSLQSIRHSLEQEQKKLLLKRRLSDRPSPKDLQEKHILGMNMNEEDESTHTSPGGNEQQKTNGKKRKNRKNKKKQKN